jgi:putative transposase
LTAAPNLSKGAPIAAGYSRHWHQEFWYYLRVIDRTVPVESDAHCMCRNCTSHRRPKDNAWPANKPRSNMHLITTKSSWLNQFDRFFALATDKAIRRGSFTSVNQLIQPFNPSTT